MCKNPDYFCCLMKYFLLLCSVFFFSCKSKSVQKTIAVKDSTTTNLLQTSIVVASDSMPIPNDLNKSYFSVEVIANKEAKNGTYDVLVHYGNNDAATQIRMPKADKIIKPELRRGAAPFSYIIGFHYGSDTTFKDYYLIQSTRNKTEMKYIKAYSFE